MNTKNDIISTAYSMLRISGITSQPSPAEMQEALARLEAMANEFQEKSIVVGYNFEDAPDLSSHHGLRPAHVTAFQACLAMRLMSDFGKQPTIGLMNMASAGLSILSSSSAPVGQIQYPNRMPRGSGNDIKYNQFRRYYNPGEVPKTVIPSNKMIEGDIDIFTEHFDSYLGQTETISTFTIESGGSSLEVLASALVSPDVQYTVKAVKPDTEYINITATTSLGRVTTRKIYFEVTQK